MDFLRAPDYQSTLVRLATRAAVFVIAAYPLLLIARTLETRIPLMSLPIVIGLVCGLLLIEATLVVIMKFMFRGTR